MLDFFLRQLVHANPAATLLVFGIPAGVFWPWFAGVALLAIGLPIILKYDLPQAHGLDKIMPFGRLFFAIPLVVFAAEHFTATRFIVQMVPSWIPGHLFWVLLVGVALIAAALGIVTKIYSQLAATLLGIMLFLFVALISVPRVIANSRDRFSWAVLLRDLSFSGGAFAFAGRQSTGHSTTPPSPLVTLGRFFIAIAALFFGVEHFLHPEFALGVPLEKLTPTWIPLHLFWAYLTGTVLLATGACLLLNKKARMAATYLSIMIFLVVLFVYLPVEFSIPSDIGNGLNYFVDTLLFSGAAFLLADALPSPGPEHCPAHSPTYCPMPCAPKLIPMSEAASSRILELRFPTRRDRRRS